MGKWTVINYYRGRACIISRLFCVKQKMREREIEMSNVRDRGVIDITLVEGNRYILIILDDIEWTHSPEDGPFEDGFSDDFVFDMNKIYLRVKKNLADDPYKEVSLTAPDESAPDFTDRVIMFRFLDSFIGMFAQDNDTVLTYITYDMLPEGTDVMKLQEKAFENLERDL